MDTAQIITVTGFIVTGFTASLAAFLTLFAQVRKMKQEKIKDDLDRIDTQPIRDANAAKILGDTLSVVVESLRSEIKEVRSQLAEANLKIEHLANVVIEYSRGIDMLIDQLKSKDEIPVFTKKTHSSQSSENS